LFLQNLHIQHFKNFETAEIQFSKGFNIITGANGMGKTNLLDAIHYLCISKSYFLHQDSQNIQFGKDFFALQGEFIKPDQVLQVSCLQTRDSKKQFKVNRKTYDRLSEHLGKLPVVMISPSDSELVQGNSEHRRRFMDQLLMQSDSNYVKHHLGVLHCIKQRNVLLRNAQKSVLDTDTLSAIDEQLVLHAQLVWQKRQAFCKRFKPLFQSFHQAISQDVENADVELKPTTPPDAYATELINRIEKDRIVGYTTAGPHKDDLIFTLNENSLRKYGSQGQQKSCILAIKLAQHRYLKEELNLSPILLLDDFSDKLDAVRLNNALNVISQLPDTQIFLTDTQNPINRQAFLIHEIQVDKGTIRADLTMD